VLRKLSVLKISLLAATISGCAASGVTHYTAARLVPPSPRAFEDELMTYSAPAKPFNVTGQFQTAGYDGPDASLARMREYAAALGLDGVGMIRCNLGKLSLPKAAGTTAATRSTGPKASSAGPSALEKAPVPETVVDSPKQGDCAGTGFVWESR